MPHASLAAAWHQLNCGTWRAQGEYIAPEKIENVYMRSPFVAQAFVYGDSLQATLVAVIVPDPDTLLPWAAARGLPQDLARLVTDPTVSAAVFNSILEEGRTSKLRGFEQVGALCLLPWVGRCYMCGEHVLLVQPQ